VQEALAGRDDLAVQLRAAEQQLGPVPRALLAAGDRTIQPAKPGQVLLEDARVGDVAVLVGQPWHRPVERHQVLQTEVDPDRAAVLLDRLAEVAQPAGAVEQPEAEHCLPASALELDGERLHLRPPRRAQLPHLTHGVRLVGVQPRDLAASVTARGLLGLRPRMTPFPAVVASTAGQHQPDVAAGVGVDPVPVIDPVGELDERDRLTGVPVLEPGEADPGSTTLPRLRLGEVLQRARGVVQSGAERVDGHVTVPRMHLVAYLPPPGGHRLA
jgi:hypothetical protein